MYLQSHNGIFTAKDDVVFEMQVSKNYTFLKGSLVSGSYVSMISHLVPSIIALQNSKSVIEKLWPNQSESAHTCFLLIKLYCHTSIYIF